MELQRNNIYNMDCRKGINAMLNQGMSVDCVITDPPYLTGYCSRRRKNKRDRFCRKIQGDNDPKLIYDVIPLLYDVMKNNTPLYMFCGSANIEFFTSQVKRCFNVKNLIVWDKGNHTGGDLQAMYGRRYEFIIYANKGRALFNDGMPRYDDLWAFDKVSGKEQIHQNQKPIELLSRMILQHTKPNDLILDPFMGSCATARAAYRHDRDYIGFEIDDGYYDSGTAALLNDNVQMSFLYGKEAL